MAQNAFQVGAFQNPAFQINPPVEARAVWSGQTNLLIRAGRHTHGAALFAAHSNMIIKARLLWEPAPGVDDIWVPVPPVSDVWTLVPPVSDVWTPVEDALTLLGD